MAHQLTVEIQIATIFDRSKKLFAAKAELLMTISKKTKCVRTCPFNRFL